MSRRSWSREDVLRVVFVLLLGQLVSLNLAVNSFTSSLLSNLGVDTPLTQSFFTYLSLALVYTPILLFQRRRLLVPWYWYILLGFVDVQANYLVIKAYQFSSITSVTLLDCCTIVWIMILTWFILGTRYSPWQFMGAAVCVLGLGLVLLSDKKSGDSDGKRPILGDVLVIAGTLGYAMSNVGEEFCVKKRDRVEVVSMLGVFGLLVSICQISIFERKNLESVKWNPEIILLFVGFALSTFLFYTIVPFVLKMGGSALLNLSLLTSDVWVVLIRLFLYRQKVDWLYYLSFAVVAVGLVIYSLTERKPNSTLDVEDGYVCNEYQVINQEENPDSRADAVST